MIEILEVRRIHTRLLQWTSSSKVITNLPSNVFRRIEVSNTVPYHCHLDVRLHWTQQRIEILWESGLPLLNILVGWIHCLCHQSHWFITISKFQTLGSQHSLVRFALQWRFMDLCCKRMFLYLVHPRSNFVSISFTQQIQAQTVQRHHHCHLSDFLGFDTFWYLWYYNGQHH